MQDDSTGIPEDESSWKTRLPHRPQGSRNFPPYRDRVEQRQFSRKEYHFYTQDDIGLGEAYADEYASEIIYSSVVGWLSYDGTHWEADTQEEAMIRATRLARRMKTHADGMGDVFGKPDLKKDFGKFAKGVQSTQKRRLMLENAKLDKRINVRHEELNADPSKLHLRNGVYDLEWDSFAIGHDPFDLNTRVLPISHYPDAACPEIDKYLARAQGGDLAVIEFLEEVSGYMLLPGNWYKKAMLLCGPRDTGKSLYLRLIQSMLGPENVSNLTLHKLTENRFASSGLFGKLANICGDLDSRMVEHTDTFMLITGGDRIDTEGKYGGPLRFTPEAKLIFSANELPFSANETEAYLSRWLIIPFLNQVPENEQDPDLEAKITTPAELSGWLLRSLDGLTRLVDRGYFDPPQAVREAITKHKDEIDSVRAFFHECCQFGDTYRVKCKWLYDQYVVWCKSSDRKPLRKNIFYNKVTADWSAAIRETKRDGYPYYVGVELKSDYIYMEN